MNMQHADDTVLIATSSEDLQRLLDIVVEESQTCGLCLNAKKIFCLVISEKPRIPDCDINIRVTGVSLVLQF